MKHAILGLRIHAMGMLIAITAVLACLSSPAQAQNLPRSTQDFTVGGPFLSGVPPIAPVPAPSVCYWIYIPGGQNHGINGYTHASCPSGEYMRGFRTYREGDWTRTGHFHIECCR